MGPRRPPKVLADGFCWVHLSPKRVSLIVFLNLSVESDTAVGVGVTMNWVQVTELEVETLILDIFFPPFCCHKDTFWEAVSAEKNTGALVHLKLECT